MQGLDIILRLCYGNHPQTSQHKAIAEDILLVLRAEESVARDALLREAGLNPHDENDVRRFDRVMGKLRGNNTVGVQVVTSFKQAGNTRYATSRQAFETSLDGMKRNVRYFLGDVDAKRVQQLAEHLPDDPATDP